MSDICDNVLEHLLKRIKEQETKNKTQHKTGEMKEVINKRSMITIDLTLSTGKVNGVGKVMCWLVES